MFFFWHHSLFLSSYLPGILRWFHPTKRTLCSWGQKTLPWPNPGTMPSRLVLPAFYHEWRRRWGACSLAWKSNIWAGLQSRYWGGGAMVKLICSLIESLKYFWSFDRNFNVRRYLRVQRNPYWLCWLTRTCSCIPRVLKAKRASTIRQRATRSSPPGFHPYSTRYITWHLCFRSLSYINAFT